MAYKIISTNGNQTEISVDIDGSEYTSLIICNKDELDATVLEFVDSIKNPRVFQQIETVDLNAIVLKLNAKVDAQSAEIKALKGVA